MDKVFETGYPTTLLSHYLEKHYPKLEKYRL